MVARGICGQQARKPPYGRPAVAGRDIPYAPVVHVRSDLVPETGNVHENPLRVFGFNQAYEQLKFRFEIVIDDVVSFHWIPMTFVLSSQLTWKNGSSFISVCIFVRC